jgi:hypothetical protein
MIWLILAEDAGEGRIKRYTDFDSRTGNRQSWATANFGELEILILSDRSPVTFQTLSIIEFCTDWNLNGFDI